MAYSKGLHDLGDGCHAWLQPDGGWGWSNSGLVTGGGASLLVDTLFDLVTTRQMLDGIRPLTDRAPLTTVVNTHSDGDHCFGNELVASPGVEIIASDAAARLITQHAVEEISALPRTGRAGGSVRGSRARAVPVRRHHRCPADPDVRGPAVGRCRRPRSGADRGRSRAHRR